MMRRGSENSPGFEGIRRVEVGQDQSLRSGEGADVIDVGPPRAIVPLSSGLLTLAGLLILAAGAGGYAAGRLQSTATGSHPPSPPSPAPANPNNLVIATGHRCSGQVGDRLQLGIEVVNRSATAITVRQVDPILPLHGLRATGSTWGSCGQLPPVPSGPGYPLPGGATTWLTITFDVLQPCPGPLPVGFALTYTQDGHPGISNPAGFNDLSDVPYTRCTPSPS
jgi:hypothetical protein